MRCASCNWRLSDTDCAVLGGDGRPYCSTACRDAEERRHTRGEVGRAQGDWRPVGALGGVNRGFQRIEHK
jgi:hypothetical protein